ncbi:hypothetical protein IV203_029646 [Nitzschia inconspicua]|uniref:Uncharacterized protein n=1 Tax=Nitzschia inconspicua TaxID=303405 RepID=A0A9K3LUN0_9STRA|nr:hypothetical protein IV203_029646 [Nitzschia inconspicua]
MQNLDEYHQDHRRSYDTHDAVDAGELAAATIMPQRNLPVLEREPEVHALSNTCNMSKLKCPTSLVSQMRKHHKKESSSRNRDRRHCRPVDIMAYHEEEANLSDDCGKTTFDFSSAQSIVHSIVNPCSPAFQDVNSDAEEDDVDGNNSLVKPTPSSHRHRSNEHDTPPTSGSSSGSDVEDETSHSTTENGSPCPDFSTSTIKQGKSRKKGTTYEGTALFSHRSPLPNGRDLFVSVGRELYHLTNTSTGCIANRLQSQNLLPREKKTILDLTCHSSLEWTMVLEFLKPSREDRERVGWGKLPILLPWFVELRSLPLVGEADMFLLHNVLGGRSDGTTRPISLANLLKLSKISYSCGLETTKNQVRRFLRHSLLHPRKLTTSHFSNVPEQEQFEVEWDLEDLKALAELMTTFDEFREYLWEYAVITYLPHDLNVSDSWGLVSNSLFPYLLREGMMQMMILESMEASSYSENRSFNRKTSKSFSDVTTSSDTTIPTSPTKGLQQKEIEHNLLRIIRHLEKFQNEKEMSVSEYVSEESSSGMSHEKVTFSTPSSRRRRNERKQAILSPTPPRQERFAC